MTRWDYWIIFQFNIILSCKLQPLIEVSEFWLSRPNSRNPTEYQSAFLFHAHWMPVELFDDRNVGYTNQKTDVWAFGMTILELYTERVPFSAVAHDAAAMVDLYYGGIPRRPERQELLGIDSELVYFESIWQIIVNCCSRDPRARPAASVIYRELNPTKLSCDKPLPLPPPLEDRIPVSPIVTDSGYREYVFRIHYS